MLGCAILVVCSLHYVTMPVTTREAANLTHSLVNMFGAYGAL